MFQTPAIVEPSGRSNGNAEELADVIDGRAHFSIRELNRLHAQRMKDTIREYHIVRTLVIGLEQPGCPLYGLTKEQLEKIISHYTDHSEPLVQHLHSQRLLCPLGRGDSHLRIAVRKRPLLPFELKSGEYDVIDTDHSQSTIVCHDGCLARSGRRLTMNHRFYRFDKIWGQNTDNAQVFNEEVKPLVDWTMAGNNSTVLCYGQTGTGKTHTLMGALTHVVEALQGEDIEVIFFEVHAKKAYDLLADRKEVKLLADENERVHVRGAKEVALQAMEPATVMEVLHEGLKLRSVEVTERNPISSRSHAFVELRVTSRAGRITLVDLAGSERNYETQKMTPAQHKESAAINTALMALKDCFHALHARLESAKPEAAPIQFSTLAAKSDAAAAKRMAGKKDPSQIRVPFRASRLTQVLRESFTDPAHRTLVIATVAPTTTDLQHTLNSLEHVVLMAPPLARCMVSTSVEAAVYVKQEVSSVPIQEWSHDQVVHWIATVEGGRFSRIALPRNITGAHLLQISERKLCQLFAGELRDARGQNETDAWVIDSDAGEILGRALYKCLRNEQVLIRKQAQKKNGTLPLHLVQGDTAREVQIAQSLFS